MLSFRIVSVEFQTVSELHVKVLVKPVIRNPLENVQFGKIEESHTHNVSVISNPI